MVNTSDAYNEQIYSSGRKFSAKANITLADNSSLNITDADIMQGGITIEDGVSSPNEFEIGGVVIGQLTLILNNLDNKFSLYDFYGATINIQVGLDLADGTTEWIPKGYFTVDEAISESSTVTLTALDNMSKFDKPYSKSTLKYPATLAEVLRDVCSCCNVILSTQTFLNSDYLVTERPVDDKTTFREVVSWTAQLAGCFARINYNGELTLNWYNYENFNAADNLDGGYLSLYTSGDIADGGNFTDYESGDDINGGIFKNVDMPLYINRIKSCKIATDDITVTGVQIIPTNEGSQPYLSGVDGYVISIEDNPLAQNDIEKLVYSLGQKLNGFTFRPYNIDALSNPAAEAGDVALITDRKGNKYKSIVSNLSFTIGDFASYSGDAETPNRKESTRYSVSAKAIQAAKVEVQKQLSAYDLSIEQLSSLMANAMGIYETVIKQDDGSIVCYAHDKPTLGESQIIWKKTRDAFAVSYDGGTTWHGMTAEGNIVSRVLTVIGISADWINAGSVKAENISQEYKKDVTDEINSAASGVTQAFKVADGQLWSTISQTYLSKTSAASTYATQSSLTQTANSITTEVNKKVNDSDFGTKITQNYSSVQIAWNTISKIIQLENAALNIYDGSSSSKKLLMTLNDSGQSFYNGGNFVGSIGTNSWAGKPSKRGLMFSLDGGQYMAWGDKEGDYYITKLSYYNDTDLNLVGLHLGTDLYTNDYYLYIGRDGGSRLQRWSNGSGIGNVGDPSNSFQIVGNDNYIIFSGDIGGANFYKNLYMWNYSIYDTSIQNSSDMRLKKDISESKVNALNVINNIECKEFKWKDDDRFEELGFISQQVGNVNKKFIGEKLENGEIFYTIDQLSMIPYLVKAVQELSDKVESLEEEIALLKGNKSSKTLKKNIKPKFSKDDKFDLSDIKKKPKNYKCEPVKPQEMGFKDLGNGKVEFFKREKKSSE